MSETPEVWTEAPDHEPYGASTPPSRTSDNRRPVAVYDTVRRRRVDTDAFMSPGEGCLDCFVGEPHVCPLLVWTTLTVVEDEHGVCTVAEAS